MAKPVQVLLLTDDPTRKQRWTDALAKSAEFCTPDWSAEEARLSVPEVVVTDQLPVGDRLIEFGPLLARGEIGIIAVATGGTADVVLPADCTRRELRLACRLLAEIIRLRRRRGRQQRAQRVLEKLAFCDGLTGLANRRAWDAELAVRLDDGGRQPEGLGLCLAVLDLDHFKAVNDGWGHPAGDQLLCAVAQGLARGVREGDLVARVGGDEFGVLLVKIECGAAPQVVERIRQRVARTVVDVSGEQISVTASAGFLAIRGGQAAIPQDAVAAIDRALRQAKADGRNRSAAATPPDQV